MARIQLVGNVTLTPTKPRADFLQAARGRQHTIRKCWIPTKILYDPKVRRYTTSITDKTLKLTIPSGPQRRIWTSPMAGLGLSVTPTICTSEVVLLFVSLLPEWQHALQESRTAQMVEIPAVPNLGASSSNTAAKLRLYQTRSLSTTKHRMQ